MVPSTWKGAFLHNAAVCINSSHTYAGRRSKLPELGQRPHVGRDCPACSPMPISEGQSGAVQSNNRYMMFLTGGSEDRM